MDPAKLKIIETLTGIRSSKKNYYVELQQKIEEVTIRNKQLEIINRVAKSFNVDLPIERIINCMVEKLKTVIPVDDCCLSTLVDGECQNVVGDHKACSCKTTDCQPNSICRYIIKNKRSLILPDEAKSLGLIVSHEVCPGSAVFVPLMVKSRVLGIFTIKSRLKGAYTPSDVAFLMQLAEHLAVGINNIRLFSEVRHREREWEDTFRAVTDAIVIVNTDRRIIRANETARKIFQLDNNELSEKKCYEVIHKRPAPCDACPMQAGTTSMKRTYQFLEGADKDVYDVYGYPMFGRNGKINGVFESFKNVTQQIAIESQLVQSEKLAAIGKLAAGVAHELNSPLTAILGNAQLLLREFPPDHEKHVLIEDIRQCGVRSKNIILNLLSFARQKQLDGEAVSINEVVNRAVRLVGHQIRQEQIALECRQEPDLPEVTGSSQQLEQVLINLLVNAKDALEGMTEGKRITITNGRCVRNGEEHLFIAVEDNGCGMGPEQLSQIFTPFFTTKDVGKGTGLGLAVSLGIVQTHGGTIECESRPGAGSKFTVLLPVK